MLRARFVWAGPARVAGGLRDTKRPAERAAFISSYGYLAVFILMLEGSEQREHSEHRSHAEYSGHSGHDEYREHGRQAGHTEPASTALRASRAQRMNE